MVKASSLGPVWVLLCRIFTKLNTTVVMISYLGKINSNDDDDEDKDDKSLSTLEINVKLKQGEMGK